MCGIFGVLRGIARREAPDRSSICEALDAAEELITSLPTSAMPATLRSVADVLAGLNDTLNGAPGARTLVRHSDVLDDVARRVGAIESRVCEFERSLEAGAIDGGELEATNSAIVALKDATWAILRDRVRTARAIAELAIGQSSLPAKALQSLPDEAIDGYLSIQLALSAIDRLEVRGRDSAGVAVLISGHDLSESELDGLLSKRANVLFTSGTAYRCATTAVFVFKAAAEIGALGDNIRSIRAKVQSDEALRTIISRAGARVAIVAHTRWASMGTISEPNAHPVDSQERESTESAGVVRPCVVASHNGDIDNYGELCASEHLRIPEEITTDTKIIPMLIARSVASGHSTADAFRSTVNEFAGSFAIAAANAEEPGAMYFAAYGGGRGCYVGFAEDCFVVASEPYGLAEVCHEYVRIDGEATDEQTGVRGEIVRLHATYAGQLEGIERETFSGNTDTLSIDDVTALEVTTRDIDRGDAPHFLLKEISEAPQSMRRTLRGKLIDREGRLDVRLSEDAFPSDIRQGLTDGTITRIIGIGQGTAYVASRSLGVLLERLVPAGISVSVQPATEVSGFGLRDDMSDTLVVAVSQSGTTTDTNRTVDMIRARGGRVVAVVNRRQSDLSEKADGVLYTSDGRDVEMSVASTKAFYAQVTACSLLAIAIAEEIPQHDRSLVQPVLRALRQLPDAMVSVLAKRDDIARYARQFAPYRRSWAIVGNGPNHIAAHEVRIKLSELCYKSIAFDITEDKKHIDLSAEPMILVCAAGLTGPNASDVVKEVAIYRAHKAIAIVVASEGEVFDDASAVVHVPRLHPMIDFVLSTMVGHLFGYEAALAIDNQGRLLRSLRAVVEDALARKSDDDTLMADVRDGIENDAKFFFQRLGSGEFNGHLETRTAVQIATLLRVGLGTVPLEAIEHETGKPTTPRKVISELVIALSAGVDELTRPIDAVKHQAKTVTVGISRTEESYGESKLVSDALAAGAQRNALGYRSMRALAALEPAVAETTGFTRYVVEGEISEGAQIRVVGRGGIANELTSRTDADPRLLGTKHRAAFERLVTVGRGLRDGRTVIIIPEVVDRDVIAITLLHVNFRDHLDVPTMTQVLKGYRDRYYAIEDAVMETQSHFDVNKLEELSVIDLLVEPVRTLSGHWKEV